MWAKEFLKHNFVDAYNDRHRRFTEWEKSETESVKTHHMEKSMEFSSVEFLELFAHAIGMGCEGLLLEIGRVEKKSRDLKEEIVKVLRSQKLKRKDESLTLDVYQAVPGYWMANIVLPSHWEKTNLVARNTKINCDPCFLFLAMRCRRIWKISACSSCWCLVFVKLFRRLFLVKNSNPCVPSRGRSPSSSRDQYHPSSTGTRR